MKLGAMERRGFGSRSAFCPRCAKNQMDGGEKEKHGANSETKRRNTSNVTESRHVTRLQVWH